MARKKRIYVSDIVKDIKKEASDSKHASSNYKLKTKIPSIVEFINSEKYLNFSPENESTPTPTAVQMLAFKSFYRGSPGNEDLTLTEEEINLCENLSLNNDENGNLIDKWNNGEIFRELVLVWGRRAGKDWTVGVIAAYEACRLLEMSNGDPYKFYRLDRGNEISILTVASSSGQASLAFNEIESKIFSCKYFENRYIPEGIEQNAIHILTEKDIIDNEERKSKKLPLKKGSICIEVGHSNSGSLRGKQMYVCILDEVAFYKQTGGSASGDQIYQGLSPSVKTFVRKEKFINEDGKEETIKHFDGKMIVISSPMGQDGLLWNLFSKANQVNHRLAIRAATWDINPIFTEDELRKEFPDRSEEEFLTEFGAEFSGTSGNNFFVREEVLSCFNPGLKLTEIGKPGIGYFVHLDPATSSHNYALCMVHKEMFSSQKKSSLDFRIVVDLLKFWYPDGSSIKVETVDNYLLWLKDRFYLAKLTYDQYRSEESIKKMRKAGLPAKMTRFTLSYKMSIYQELYNLISSGKLIIPDDGSKETKLLKNEMLHLQKKDSYQGWRVFAKKDGETKTDDMVDALAGSVHACISTALSSYPKSMTTELSIHSPAKQVWSGPQGPLGVGTPSEIEKWKDQMGVPKFE